MVLKVSDTTDIDRPSVTVTCSGQDEFHLSGICREAGNSDIPDLTRHPSHCPKCLDVLHILPSIYLAWFKATCLSIQAIFQANTSSPNLLPVMSMAYLAWLSFVSICLGGISTQSDCGDDCGDSHLLQITPFPLWTPNWFP